jgi:hypothetical protein
MAILWFDDPITTTKVVAMCLVSVGACWYIVESRQSNNSSNSSIAETTTKTSTAMAGTTNMETSSTITAGSCNNNKAHEKACASTTETSSSPSSWTLLKPIVALGLLKVLAINQSDNYDTTTNNDWNESPSFIRRDDYSRSATFCCCCC